MASNLSSTQNNDESSALADTRAQLSWIRIVWARLLVGWIVLIGPVIAGIWGLIEGILILSSSTGSEWHKDGKGYELRD